MKERPILFSAPMIRAILDGRKTQTRRIIKPQPILHYRPELYRVSVDEFGRAQWRYDDPIQSNAIAMVCGPDNPSTIQSKYGAIGDRLWVRETWQAEELDIDSFAGKAGTDGIRFAADGKFQAIENSESAAEKWCAAYANGKWQDRWRPSSFMPRWASRITLEIVSVRVERLNEISDLDACAEGADGPFPTYQNGEIGESGPESFIAGYKEIWESINGKGSWAKNPWVFVIEFKKL